MAEDSVLIISGEASGELYGSMLASRLKGLHPQVVLYGVGGEHMKAEGVHLLGTVTGTFGLWEALSHLGQIRALYRKVVEFLKTKKPAVVVLIDFPDFNLKVASQAKALGLKVLYYVSPQIWAWRKKRIEKIKKLCDKMAVILPFEEKLYRDASVDAEFVGHPIMEEIERVKGSKAFIREGLGLSPEGEAMAFLPGSRRSELKRHLPLYHSVLRDLKRRYQNMQFLMPLAETLRAENYPRLEDMKAEGLKIFKGRATEVLMASDYALVASGTATLQAALIGVPMVVVYKLFPITYLIGRMVVDVKFISLVNILSKNREVVKELIQWDANRERVMKELDKIIKDEPIRAMMLEQFARLREVFKDRRPSERVAEIVCELAGWTGKEQ
ncbi:MAG: lipid-A-disaccharide synthase [Nitrospirae bacterium]|nr:MAG: lipid-A-disaccharide synthase [Nitrospirota bacterium]